MKNKRTINYSITDHQFYYLAGVIDAGSSFILNEQACGRKNPTTGKYSMRWINGFTIQSTNSKLIEYFTQTLFLGDSHTHILNLQHNGHNHRLLKSIRVTGQILDYIIPKLIPLLKVKQEHAKVILDFRKTIKDGYGTHNPIPLSIQEYRNELHNKMSYLNSSEYKNTISSPLLPSTLPKCC